ncbi:MAG: hypothetical protein M1830_002403, partial [Pleopsidium flavum]
MDPLSISASIVALGGFAIQTLQFIKGIKDGGEERSQFLAEVKNLSVLLTSVEGYCKVADTDERASWMLTFSNLTDKGGILDETGAALDKLNKILETKKGAHKIIQTLRWPTVDKSEVDSTFQRVSRLNQIMSIVFQQASTSLATATKEDTGAMRGTLDNQNTRAILEWLSTLNMWEKQDQYVRKKQEGTGRWLFACLAFRKWMTSEDSILWSAGIPGAGKTFLAAIVTQHLQEIRRQQNAAVFVLYCSYNEPKTQSVDSLTASLLKQAIQATGKVYKELEELHESHYKQETRPTRSEVLAFFNNTVNRYKKIYIVVDALDELLEEASRLELLEVLRSFQGNVKIMVTSRDLPNIRKHFGPSVGVICCKLCRTKPAQGYYHCRNCPDFNICTECNSLCKGTSVDGHFDSHLMVRQFPCQYIKIKAAEKDLQTYVSLRINQNASLRSMVAKKQGLEGEIIDTVTHRAGEVFLLAKFHMDILQCHHRPLAIVKALNELPSRMDDVYDQAMKQIKDAKETKDEAIAFLKWVVHAHRPLTVQEIEHATATWRAKNTLTLITSLVPTLFARENYFNHVQDESLSDAPTCLGRICLTYLLFDAFSEGPCSGREESELLQERADEFPLLIYASLYWGRYVNDSKDSALHDMALKFLLSEPHRASSTQMLWYAGSRDAAMWEAREKTTALHLASFFGLESIVSQILRSTHDLNAQDSMGMTPLLLASQQGHPAVVASLVQAGATVNTACKGTTALHRAVLYEQVAVVKVLLSCEDLDVNAYDIDLKVMSPLSQAIVSGQCDIVEELLGREDLNLYNDFQILDLAASSGELEIVQVLLRHPRTSADVKAIGSEGALHTAAANGEVEIVKLLLEAGTSPEKRDWDGGTPMLRAIDRGEITMVKLLLDHKVKLGSRDMYNRTLAHGAAINNHPMMLRLLFEKPSALDIDAQGSNNGRTALHDAAEEGFLEVTKVLLDFKARTDIKDDSGLTPKQLAKQSGHTSIYDVLCEAESSHLGTLQRVDTGLSPVMMPIWAAAKFHRTEKILDILRSNQSDPDFNVDDPDPTWGRTALHHAAERGDTPIVNALIAAGADVNALDEQGHTPLWFAVFMGHVSTAETLLDNDADPDAECLVPLAERFGYWKLAVLLIQHEGLMEEEEYAHETFSAAAAYGNTEVVRKLLAKGAETQRKDKDGLIPFQLAKREGHEETANLLLQHTRKG